MSKIAQARWYGSDIGRWRLQMPVAHFIGANALFPGPPKVFPKTLQGCLVLPAL